MANEKRLIDANALGHKRFYVETIKGSRGWVIDYEDLSNAPTVDAVEVVRCKDCRWARSQDHREPTETPKGYLICQCFMHHHIPAPWGGKVGCETRRFLFLRRKERVRQKTHLQKGAANEKKAVCKAAYVNRL